MSRPLDTATTREAILAYFEPASHPTRNGAVPQGFPQWISTFVAQRLGIPLVGHGHASDAVHKRVCKVLRGMKDDGLLVSTGNAQNTQYKLAPTSEEIAEREAKIAAYNAEVEAALEAANSLVLLGAGARSSRTEVIIDVETAQRLVKLLRKEVAR